MDSGAYFAYGKRNDPGDETLFKSIYKRTANEMIPVMKLYSNLYIKMQRVCTVQIQSDPN